MPRSTRQLWVLGALSAVLAIVVAFTGWQVFLREDSYAFQGGTLTPVEPAPAMPLTDMHGQPFDLSSYEGKVVLLYFGYTFCPDFCPTTMLDMQHVLAELGDDADNVEVVMVSVDPDRDTPERLQEWLSFFDDRFLGVTGSQEDLLPIARAYGVTWNVHEPQPGATYYLVDHSTQSFAIDANGNLRLTWAWGTDADVIAEDVKHLLET